MRTVNSQWLPLQANRVQLDGRRRTHQSQQPLQLYESSELDTTGLLGLQPVGGDHQQRSSAESTGDPADINHHHQILTWTRFVEH